MAFAEISQNVAPVQLVMDDQLMHFAHMTKMSK